MALSKLNNRVAIGIDLGTTSSAVGVWRNGKVEIIPNDRRQTTTPSYIAFTGDGGRLIGDAAKSQVAENPKNTVWGFKTLLGRSFDDPAVQEWTMHWPFKVLNVGGKPNVEVEQTGEIKRFTPEELTCLLLLKLEHTAEAYLGHGVTDAVITIPACFAGFQVTATKKAAELAGLNVLKLVSDPTAAALTFIEQTRRSGGDQEKKNILVVNVGGATTGMSVVTVKDTILKVRATDGNTNLGGEHLDNKIMGDVSTGRGNLTKRNPGASQRRRKECGRAKRVFSCGSTAIFVDLDDGTQFFRRVTRVHFAELCRDLFLDTVVGPLDGLLRDTQMERSDIHEVVLVGGSSRIPNIQSLLQEYFNGKTLNKSLDSDEAPAHGAAILAAILTPSGDPLIDTCLLEDVTPFSLGVLTTKEGEEAVTTLIKMNTLMPAKQTYTFTTVYDGQSAVIIAIYEGETGKYSTLLATFFLSEIPPAPAGVPRIDITFEVDANGTLTVTAVEKSTGQEKRITIDPGNEELLTKEELAEKLVNEVKGKKIQDYQKAYALVKSSYEAIGKLFFGAEESKDFRDKIMKELEVEEKRYEFLLTPQEFPIVAVPVCSTNGNSGGRGVELGGPKSKKRRNE